MARRTGTAATARVKRGGGTRPAPAARDKSAGAVQSLTRGLQLLQRLTEGGTVSLLQVPTGTTSPDRLSAATVDKLVTFLKQR